MAVGVLVAGTFLVASLLAGPALSVGLLLLVGVSYGLSTSNVWPITQILAGPQASGRWTGLQCAFANSSGAVASALTGFILDRTGHFFWAFAVAAAFSFAGALCWMFLVCQVEPVSWARQTSVDVGEAIVEPA